MKGDGEAGMNNGGTSPVQGRQFQIFLDIYSPLKATSPALPRPTSPLQAPNSPAISTSSAPHPLPGVLNQPGATGDTATPSEGLRGKEDQYLVTFDIDPAISNQTSDSGLKLFDINTFLAGAIDITDLLNSVH